MAHEAAFEQLGESLIERIRQGGNKTRVLHIDVDRSGKHATGVTFVDSSGEQWEQPADLVILSAYTLFNVQLLLHSKIGRPYDPVANSGTLGRNYTHQTISTVNGTITLQKS